MSEHVSAMLYVRVQCGGDRERKDRPVQVCDTADVDK